MTKRCTKCGETKADDAFRVRKSGTLFSHCKSCDNARAAAWQKANRERARLNEAAYDARNREARKQQAKLYRSSNPEKANASTAKWRSENSERMREMSRDWYYRNPAAARASEARRRAAKLRAIPPWADADKIAEIYAQAAELRALGVDCHVDHIVPLQGRTVSGLHCQDNLQILLASDNLSKGNRLSVSV